jgi:2-oxoglutarate dehydrogenase E2 component (dihydrolipoamide succinyltransferase)
MTEITVPALPESVADATLINWYKKEGDFVEKNENLVDLETDKVVLEVPAPQAGILVKLLKNNGDVVISGEILAVLETADAPLAVEAQPATSESIGTTALSPAVRRLVNEKQLDPTVISGSGKSGRITKTDVLDFLSKSNTITTPQPKSTVVPQSEEAEIPKTTEADFATNGANLRPEQRVPMTRLRAKVAERKRNGTPPCLRLLMKSICRRSLTYACNIKPALNKNTKSNWG